MNNSKTIEIVSDNDNSGISGLLKSLLNFYVFHVRRHRRTAVTKVLTRKTKSQIGYIKKKTLNE